MKIVDFDERIIKDPKLIKRYDEEFKYNFYQPSTEENWLDPNIVNNSIYHNSRKSTNYVFSPLYVAVNDRDEKLDDPVERIHGRLLDGRQRYADSKKNNEPWPVTYVYIKDFKEFLMVIATMGSKKDAKIQGLQTQSIIRNFCEMTWKQKPREIYDREGFPDKQKVAAYVTTVLSGRWSEATILNAIPQEYKNRIRSEAGQLSARQAKPISKLRKENINLKEENTRQTNYIIELEKKIMPDSRKDEVIRNNERTIKQLKITLGLVKSDIKEARKKAGMDKTGKDFDMYWESVIVGRLVIEQ